MRNMRVLNQAVVPTGLYACEVWGLGALRNVNRGVFGLSDFYALSDPVEMGRCALLRSWLRLPRATAKVCLLHELGLQPLTHDYTRRAVGLWNTLVVMPDDSPYRLALKQNIEDAFDNRNFKGGNFARSLFNVLKLLGVEQRLESTMRDMRCIEAQVVEQKLLSKYEEWVSLLRVQGGVIGPYFSLVGTHVVGQRPVWYSINVSYKVAVRFLRFRIGCHHLRVHTGRWMACQLQRRQRKCIRCAHVFEQVADVPVDDENHCLIHCQEPVLAQHRMHLEQQIRRWLPHAAINSMTQLYVAAETTNKKSVQRQLMGYVAHCFRVARCCHEDLEAWQHGLEVQEVLAVDRLAEWLALQEALYARGMVPGLPSDSSVDESSELSEVSDLGWLEHADLFDATEVSIDSEEWEDVV
jgi:hypothetical protein